MVKEIEETCPTFQGITTNKDKNPLLEVTKNVGLMVNMSANNNDRPLGEKVNLDGPLTCPIGQIMKGGDLVDIHIANSLTKNILSITSMRWKMMLGKESQYKSK